MHSRRKFFIRKSTMSMPVRENPDTLKTLAVYADGASLEARRVTGELLDDAVIIEIGWEQLAEACAFVVAGMQEDRGIQFIALLMQKYAEAVAVRQEEKEGT